MLSQQIVESAILKWLEDFIEVPHPNLGNWPPCPFARQARLNKTYEIRQGTDVFADGINLSKNWNSSKEVVILWYDNISVGELVERTKELNQQLMLNNLVALEGHPNLSETINEVDLRFMLCPIVVYQQLDKLNQASAQLKAKGYYNAWSQENLDKIVNFRHDKL